MLTTALFLLSCKTPQQTAVQQRQLLRENAERQEQMLRSLQTQVEEMQARQICQQTESNQRTQTRADDLSEVITEEYDTTQPVDSATGTPPLKSRIIEKRNQRTQTQTAAAQETRTEQTDHRQSTLHHTEQDTATATETAQCHTDTQTDTQQHTGLNWWQTTLCTIGAVVIVALLLYLAFQVLKRYIKPF